MDHDRETWWQDKEQRSRALADDIQALAERARAAGFQTTSDILNLVFVELSKDLEK